MATAWEVLKSNSTLVSGTAWEHLNNQAGGDGGTVVHANGLSVVVAKPEINVGMVSSNLSIGLRSTTIGIAVSSNSMNLTVESSSPPNTIITRGNITVTLCPGN